MATENVRTLTSITAGEDLRTLRYHAIALDDGKLANNGREALGILVGTPRSGEAAAVAITGEEKFKAGEGLSAGNKLTVATSGWFTKAASGDWLVGVVKAAVTSGSLGTGIFRFPGHYCETSASAT